LQLIKIPAFNHRLNFIFQLQVVLLARWLARNCWSSL